MKHFSRALLPFAFIFTFSLIAIFSLSPRARAGEQTSPPAGPRKSAEFFEESVQPLLNKRCVACHSCFDAPCQLNMQSPGGLLRGAFHANVYDGTRLKPVEPTRLFEDAETTNEWRQAGFYTVLGTSHEAPATGAAAATKTPGTSVDHVDVENNILLRMIALAERRNEFPHQKVREDLLCAKDEKEMAALEKNHPDQAMPYGFPALTQGERTTLKTWVQDLARLPSPPAIPELSLAGAAPDLKKQARSWESFLNQKDLEHRVVARYLFEHLYLAHFMGRDHLEQHLKLVRSGTTCEKGITPVQARRANSDPGLKEWSYCFYLDPSATVYKNHIPYELSAAKLAWLKKNFFTDKWKAKAFPSFEATVAANPMVAFADIPILARDQFLLQDARFHVMTFIKGPVCNGSIAVNVIQEQFYVLFQSPKADLMVQDPQFARDTAPLLTLPGAFGDDGKVIDTLKDYKNLVEWHNRALDLQNAALQKLRPQGLKIDDIWNGDGQNPNALLTVFRHDDNADVQFGARGDLPKTAFVLDYSVFERMVYDLVVNFDVFGNVKHQSLTRLYMDFLRMNAEDNYLDYLPPADRLSLKKSWYEGRFTTKKLELLHEFNLSPIPSGVQFEAGPESTHRQFLNQVLFRHLSSQARGTDDTLNWKKLKSAAPASELQSELGKLAAVTAVDATPFARFFPELSILLLKPEEGDAAPVAKIPSCLYSLIHNREHDNVSWMMAEKARMVPEEDSLSIEEGVMGGYPNQFFEVSRRDLPVFVKRVLAMKTDKDYETVLKTFGVRRSAVDFWEKYDAIEEAGRTADPREFGILDLSRYSDEKDAKDPARN